MTGIEVMFWLTLAIYAAGVLALMMLPKKVAPVILAVFGITGSATMFACGTSALFATNAIHIGLWSIPGLTGLKLTIDHLAAFFLMTTGLVAMPASLFAANRIKDGNGHPVTLAGLYLALLISLPLVVTASDVFTFLIAWELMSVLIYLLINSGAKERPGYLMLALGEAGTLAVLAALVLMSSNSGSLSFATMKTAGIDLSVGLRRSIFLLSFLGFGVKAGLIPVNFWLSRAYATAPTPTIPLIAGATLNMGLYGIIRVNADLLPVSAGMGVVVLLIGASTALIGILYATIEDDLKTLLAHSSIENAGIITTAIGAGMVFVATGHKGAASIAFIAAFYHLLNHSVYKTLLFMGAGAIEDSTGIRNLDRMGGLLKYLQWTGLFVLIGVLSVSALPPFNGFVSEWLILQALLRSVGLASLGIKLAFVVAGVLLALTAGLTVTCFVRAFSMGFLGIKRSETISRARETGRSSLIAMGFLAITALVLGVLPTYMIPTIDRAVAPLTNAKAATLLVPPFFNNFESGNELPQGFIKEFHAIGAQVGQDVFPVRGMVVMHRGGKENPVVFAMSTFYTLLMLTFLLLLTFFVVRLISGKQKVTRGTRWDGGVRKLLPEMTYTATGFAHPVRVIFNMILRPRIANRQNESVKHFRDSILMEREEVHLIDKLFLKPVYFAAQWVANKLAVMHSGRVNTYAGFALFILIFALLIAQFI